VDGKGYDLQRYLLIALGGALGSIARYFVGGVVAERMGVRFYYGTLLINVSACFLIGLVLEYLNHHAGLSSAWRYFVPIGFLGAYSTFSTFEWEAWSSFTSGAFWMGILYITVSIIAGLIAVAAGAASVRSLS
jgi:CrcB protein